MTLQIKCVRRRPTLFYAIFKNQGKKRKTKALATARALVDPGII